MTKRTTPSPIIRTIAATAALGLAGLGLTGCSLDINNFRFDQAEWQWTDLADANTTNEGTRIPELVPDDATDITLLIDQRAFGAQIEWSSTSGITADYCEPGALSGTSEMKSNWWPEDIPAEGWVCGFWEAFQIDDTYYAWDTREKENA